MMFSIIVPIYNVEEYLPQCIESVLNQSFLDFELLLIDDGSPDSSGKICDKYAEKDNRIRVIHKTNGGLSDARNVGIKNANGVFLWFLDSDDYMVDDSMGKIAEVIYDTNPDMVTCAHNNDYNDGINHFEPLPYNTSNTAINRECFLEKLYKSNGNYWAAWSNIYKRSIISNNNLEFPNGLIGAEDCDFFMEYLKNAEKFVFFNMPVVNYRASREGSITNDMSKKSIEGRLKVYIKHYHFFNMRKDELNNNMKILFANKFSNGVYHLAYLDNEKDIQYMNNYVKENKEILKNTRGLKYSLAKLVWGLLGYYKGSIILRFVNQNINKE